eukprot:TRINITY_DN22875_c0_g1_i1.p1 TRINITY_DN22875_c0_g1~~TRINITY_DN22875_c0_g1_i1.p1  ORF type:complete len:340 (+),score=71.15 TRINITY_DN22875_c0_g1_i1:57-1022(+)
MAQLMKAGIYKQYGDASVMQFGEVPKPKPKPDEILVQVKYSSVTSGDWRVRKADPWAVRLFNGLCTPSTQTLGTEFSGIVAETGEKVTNFLRGDRVFGSTGMSMRANCEFITIKESAAVCTMPDQLSFEEAAVIPFGGTTANYFLKELVKPGMRVLVIGASGSVGVHCVQLAKHYGGEVTAVCSTNNIDLVKSLGASHTVDYTKENFLTTTTPYDIIVDVCGKSSFSECRPILSKKGSYEAISGGLKDFGWAFLNPFRNQKVHVGVCDETKSEIQFLKSLREKGSLKGVVGTTYPLAKISEAHAFCEAGHKPGGCALAISN